MFLPATLFLFVAGLYIWKTCESAQLRNWKDFRIGVLFSVFFLSMSVVFGGSLFGGRHNPSAWGVGTTILCRTYGC
jgi:hypothetical protein